MRSRFIRERRMATLILCLKLFVASAAMSTLAVAVLIVLLLLSFLAGMR